jgi:hypothetical protein
MQDLLCQVHRSGSYRDSRVVGRHVVLQSWCGKMYIFNNFQDCRFMPVEPVEFNGFLLQYRK